MIVTGFFFFTEFIGIINSLLCFLIKHLMLELLLANCLVATWHMKANFRYPNLVIQTRCNSVSVLLMWATHGQSDRYLHSRKKGWKKVEPFFSRPCMLSIMRESERTSTCHMKNLLMKHHPSYGVALLF